MKLKLKTCKAAAKRIKIKTFSILRKKAYKSHLLKRKNSQRLRRLSVFTKLIKNQTFKFFKMNTFKKLKKDIWLYKRKRCRKPYYYSYDYFLYSLNRREYEKMIKHLY